MSEARSMGAALRACTELFRSDHFWKELALPIDECLAHLAECEGAKGGTRRQILRDKAAAALEVSATTLTPLAEKGLFAGELQTVNAALEAVRTGAFADTPLPGAASGSAAEPNWAPQKQLSGAQLNMVAAQKKAAEAVRAAESAAVPLPAAEAAPAAAAAATPAAPAAPARPPPEPEPPFDEARAREAPYDLVQESGDADVIVTIPIPPAAGRKQVNVTIRHDTLRVTVEGHPLHPVVDGRLPYPIDVDGSGWELVAGKGGKPRRLVLTLEKASANLQWPGLIAAKDGSDKKAADAQLAKQAALAKMLGDATADTQDTIRQWEPGM